MSKHILSIKKIKKQILSINDLIESNFNKLKYIKSNYKRILFSKDNRVFLALGIAVILTLLYFLIPTFYNKNIIKSQIKNQIFKNYNIEIKFKKINYGLLPKPHFLIKDLSILRNKKEIGITKNLKVFIGISQFFSINRIKIKDLIFYKTDFNIYFDDLLFFQNLLKTEPHENRIFIKNSNIFFKDKNDDVLFINKINNGEFYYDFNNLKNVLSAKNEIFNLPFKLEIKNDKFNKKVFINFNSKKIRLNIDNETSYDDENMTGLLDVLFVSKDTSLAYDIKKNSLNFNSKKAKNMYKGLIEFKPFYFFANFDYEGLSTKNLFKEDSIFIDLIKSEILNNKNLNANFNLNLKDITNIDELNNLILKIGIEQGDISFSNSTIMWKDDLKIKLSESYLNFVDNEIYLVGKLTFNFEDIDDFYKSFQLQKKYRKKLKKVEIDIIYNFDQRKINFDNAKIDNISNPNVLKFIDKFNSSGNKILNKITFKNFINNFFTAHSG